jgi:glycosyltransferase involved in cell wall biosynthesis
MYRDSSIAAVVPAHNEEQHISTVVKTMPDFVDHIIVVDDASTDRTAEVAEGMGDRRVILIRHEANRGVGGAILSGHRKALELGADVAVVMAGDAQMDPAHLPDLLDPIVEGRADFAKGNRLYSIDSFRGMPRLRILGNIVLSFLTKLASGYWHMVDPQNGYTATARTMLDRLPFARISEGYQFENDLLIHLNVLNARLLDVPIPARYGQEVSGIRLRRVIPTMLSLLFRGFWRRIFWKYVLWSFSPVALFLFAGLFLTAWGVGFGIWVIIQTLGTLEASTGTVILSVVPFIIGVQFLIFFIVLDIQESRGGTP